MSDQDTAFEHHDRTEFQLERLILFTDAVFAIAITLLAIEIKIPEFEGRPTDHAVWDSIISLIPKFIGFLVGFTVIALFWVAHHRLFHYLRSYNQKLLWLNLLFLLSIVLMPFSSGLFSSYATVKAAFTIYAVNILFAGGAQVLLTRYLRNPAHHLIYPPDATHPDLDYWRPLATAVGFGLALLIIQFIPSTNWMRNFTPFLFLLTIPLNQLYQRRYRRLLAQHEARPAVAQPAAQ